jgi:hypothetical protein
MVKEQSTINFNRNLMPTDTRLPAGFSQCLSCLQVNTDCTPVKRAEIRQKQGGGGKRVVKGNNLRFPRPNALQIALASLQRSSASPVTVVMPKSSHCGCASR